jgi:hypothetical protein
LDDLVSEQPSGWMLNRFVNNSISNVSVDSRDSAGHPIEELISEFGFERFAVAVLPWRAGFDVQCFGSRVLQPFAQILRDELYN